MSNHRRVVGRGVHGQVHVDGQQEPRIDLADPRLVLGTRSATPIAEFPPLQRPSLA
jgi:hypothetical protein